MSKIEKFSIIIPTMWESNNLKLMLDKYEKSNLVGEIIIIDNNPKNKFNLKDYKKIIYYTENKNIFVNPAWNLGYSLSSFKTILANDDILLDDINKILLNFINCEFDIVGVDWSNKKNILGIKKIEEFPYSGYGCFMYIKNYVPIDENYKIWRGDYILFENSYNKGILEGSGIKGEISKSIKNQNLEVLAKKDKTNYENKLFLKQQKNLSVIISTYKNVDFLDLCIDSILSSGEGLEIEILIGIDSCLETLKHIKDKKYQENINFYFFEKNYGHFTVKNTLINLSKFENILFFDSDDIMDKKMIPTIVENFVNYKIIRPGYVNFKNINQKENTKYYGEGVFAIKKDLFLKMNGFEPWVCAADTEFHNRIRKRNILTKMTPETLFYRRIHNFGLTSRKDTGYGSELRKKYKEIIDSRIKYQDPERLNSVDFIIIHTNKIEMPKLSEIKKPDLTNILNKQPRKIVENKVIKKEGKRLSPDISKLLSKNNQPVNMVKKENFYSDINPIKTQMDQTRQALINQKKEEKTNSSFFRKQNGGKFSR
jgi:hypothetical protein